MRNVACLVLGGGKGTRLFPLTSHRSKPAVPLAGKYRLIDIPISNCLHSGIDRIYVLTQFHSQSLHTHIRETYRFDQFTGGFVEILAAQQTMSEESDWYQGTADAVRKNIRYIKHRGTDYVLILSGDQLYRMDYSEMLETHRKTGADVTIGALPVDEEAAAAFGIMRIEDDGRVIGFLEKPKTRAELDHVRTEPSWLDDHGIASKGRGYLASMGIYVFERDLLVNLLEKTEVRDFGKEVFPMAIRTRKVQVHPFDGFWEDIGTIKAFFETNLALARQNPPFEIMVKGKPVFTRPRFLPPTRLERVTLDQSLLADGCIIEEGTTIENSVIGLRCRIGKNVTIKNTIIMGADFYDDETPQRPGAPAIGIGEGAVIEGAIVDKNCRVGNGAVIRMTAALEEDMTNGPVMVRDGIIVVPKNTIIPAGWTFESQERAICADEDEEVSNPVEY